MSFAKFPAVTVSDNFSFRQVMSKNKKAFSIELKAFDSNSKFNPYTPFFLKLTPFSTFEAVFDPTR